VAVRFSLSGDSAEFCLRRTEGLVSRVADIVRRSPVWYFQFDPRCHAVAWAGGLLQHLPRGAIEDRRSRHRVSCHGQARMISESLPRIPTVRICRLARQFLVDLISPETTLSVSFVASFNQHNIARCVFHKRCDVAVSWNPPIQVAFLLAGR